LFKLKMSRRLAELVIKFGEEDSLWNYESFSGHLPQVNDDSEDEEEDEDENDDEGWDCEMWD
jgi:hypothetical protein